MSVIDAELEPNRVVYVYGQVYVDGEAWHEVRYDNLVGYIRADMLRMMSESEVNRYLEQLNATPTPVPQPEASPTPVITTPPYDGNSLSSYGYVAASSVNFRNKPSMTNSVRLAQLKQYAFCLILGTENVDGTIWYKVNYNDQIGYVNGDYFKQLTLSELEAFLNSPEYTKGFSNNATTSNTDNTQTSTEIGRASCRERVFRAV